MTASLDEPKLQRLACDNEPVTNKTQPEPRIQGGWRKRLFARMQAASSASYEPMVSARKRQLLGGLRGDVLEIGPGSGPNLAYLPPDARWIGVEPNPHMHPYLRDAARQYGLDVDLRTGTAEQITAGDDSVDAVISTLVLCSVHDVDRALREIRRVLKLGGRFVFLEHVAAPKGTGRRRWQNWLQPLWSLVGDGCHPNRETWANIERAGFGRVALEHFDLPIRLAGPHIAGVAVK